MPLTKDQIDYFESSLNPTFNYEIDSYLEDRTSNSIEEQNDIFNMFVSMFSIAHGGECADGFDFAAAFPITTIFLSNPKQARPGDTTIELADEDKALLISHFRTHILYYATSRLAEYPELRARYERYRTGAVAIAETVTDIDVSSETESPTAQTLMALR